MANPPHEEEFIIEDGGQPAQFQEDYGTENYNGAPEEFGAFEPKSDDAEIENPVSAVASAPAKNILILVIMAIASAFFLYKYVFKEDAAVTDEKKKQEQIAEQPVSNAVPPTKQEEKPQVNIGVVATPELPTMENSQALPPLAAPDVPKIDDKIAVPAPAQPQVTVPPVPTPTPVQIVEPLKSPDQIKEPGADPLPPLDAIAHQQPQPTGPSPEELLAAKEKLA